MAIGYGLGNFNPHDNFGKIPNDRGYEFLYLSYYDSDNSQNPPYSPFAKGGNCYPPLWPPAHRASLRGMSPSLRAGFRLGEHSSSERGLSEPEAGAEPDPEGKEGRGEIF